jgi:hypothetical protein
MASNDDVVATPVNIFKTLIESADVSEPVLVIPTQAAPTQHIAANAIRT